VTKVKDKQIEHHRICVAR